MTLYHKIIIGFLCGIAAYAIGHVLSQSWPAVSTGF